MKRTEHKSKDQVGLNELIETLDNLDSVLSGISSDSSVDTISTAVKSIAPKINLKKEVFGERMSKQEKIIQQRKKLTSEIEKEKNSIKTLTQNHKSYRKDSSLDAEQIKYDKQQEQIKKHKINNNLVKLEASLNDLNEPIPESLKSSEMVDGLISLNKAKSALYHKGFAKELSGKGLVEKVNILSKARESVKLQGIIDILEKLSFASMTFLYERIDSRKIFLQKTAKTLEKIAKLPTTLGDQDNILSIIKKLEKGLENGFAQNKEVYNGRMNVLVESLEFLIALRGKFMPWPDPRKFVAKYKLQDKSLINTINSLKSSDKGFFSWIDKMDLEKLDKLVQTVETLTKDFCLLYDIIVAGRTGNKDLTLKLKKHEKFLAEAIQLNYQNFLKTQEIHHLGFTKNQDGIISKNEIVLKQSFGQLQISEDTVSHELSTSLQKEYFGELSETISANFNVSADSSNPILERRTSKYGTENSIMSIILDYLDSNELPLNFSKHLEYLINSSLSRAKYYVEQLKYTSNAITVLSKIQQKELGSEGEVLSSPVQPKSTGDRDQISEEMIIYNKLLINTKFERNLDSLTQTKEIIKFFSKDFLFAPSKMSSWKNFFQNLKSIDIETESSKFIKLLDTGVVNSISFIDRIIDLVIWVAEIFKFDNIEKLDKSDALIVKEIGRIESYIVKQSAPMIQDFVKNLIKIEYLVLNNFSYLIDYPIKDKNSHPSSILYSLIQLINHSQPFSKILLNQDNLGKIIALDSTKHYVSVLLSQLIRSGYADIKMIDQFLKAGADVNYNVGYGTYLHSIAYLLTKVGREVDCDYMDISRKYIIDSDQQDNLLKIALHLIEKKADINIKSQNGSGFLTSLFSRVSSDQSGFLYQKLLSKKEIMDKVSLEDTDFYGRNLGHLFCRDLFYLFYTSYDKQAAKANIRNILNKMVKLQNILNIGDVEGDTPAHYLASSITSEYLTTKASDVLFYGSKGSFFNLNKKNKLGDNPLHAAFTKVGDPAAFYEFVLSSVYPVERWNSLPKLNLHAKNNNGKTVLDLIISSGSEIIASTINVYMLAAIYNVDLRNEDGTLCRFKTARKKINEFEKTLLSTSYPSTGTNIEKTIYLKNLYKTGVDCEVEYSLSSCSSLSSSSSSSSDSMFCYSSESSPSSSSRGSLTGALPQDYELEWHYLESYQIESLGGDGFL